ncbi:hypothetical protein H7I77_05205 [Mycolicibacterium novocastrense]|uniref:Metallophosphoesterase n=1 Tax=Mycolicibacterium novocastrense TaxID=59813 RepID=A0AAW5SF59_MYCNV|nr:hypothetical protein [Mycolicibacterium novocastrense]MCV7022750.1 hypothetical protein [Mycolicibacterium novocastrense]GAT10323.1 metallophosphoesterase [Mycolicibacterium novocastrense]
MKTAKLTVRQQEALELVEQGRVQYGHEFPNMARRGHATYPVFLIDGHAAYNQQGHTFASLEERGLLVIRHDLVPREPKPATTRTSRTLTGESTITIPAHDAPVDPGWRTAVELATPADSAQG